MNCMACDGPVGQLREIHNAHYCEDCLRLAKEADEKKVIKLETMPFVYRILTFEQFAEFEKTQVFIGGDKDIKDGFIHASREDQYMKTYYKIYIGQLVVLLKIDISKIAPSKIKVEADKTGETFPHIYGTVPFKAVVKYSTLCKASVDSV